MSKKTQWYHIVMLAALASAMLVFLYAVRGILPPFIIAFVIAWLLDPLLDRLQNRGCPRILAVMGVYAIFLAAFVLGLVFIVPAVIDQAMELAEDFPEYSRMVMDFSAAQLDLHRPLLTRFELPTTLQEVFARYGQQATGALTAGVQHVSRWLVANLSIALWFILIPLSAFYFLNDMGRIRRKAPLFIPEPWRPRTTEVLSRMGLVFSNYIRGLSIVCLLYGLATLLVLILLGYKYSVILALLAGVLYGVPYLGAILTTILVFLAGMATHEPGVIHPIWVALGLLVLNQIFDFGIRPKVLGDYVGLHPVLSLFALLAGAKMFGLVGMILAVPVAASIQEILFEFYPELRPPPKEQAPRRQFKLRCFWKKPKTKQSK